MKTLILFLFCAFTCFAQEPPQVLQWQLMAGTPNASISTASPFVTSESEFGPRNDVTGVVGCSFVVTANCTITSLGVYIPAGGSTSHHIGIWDSSHALLVSTNISFSGLSGYNYWSVTATSLSAGQTYYVGIEVFNAGDYWYSNTGTLSFGSNFSSLASAYGSSTWPTYPGSTSTINEAYGIATFKYTIP